MKTKIVAIILVLLLCLSSCDNMTVNNKPDVGGLVLVSAEIQESKVPSTAYFAIQIGIGNLTEGFLTNATMTVKASSPDLIITAPDGSKSKNEYTCEYADFNSGKYQTYRNSDRKSICRYFETYLFKFEEVPENHSGKISFEVCAEIDESQGPTGVSGFEAGSVNVYYKVRNGKIRLSYKSQNANCIFKFKTNKEMLPQVDK